MLKIDHLTKTYGEKIAVGVDIKDGFVAVRGWMEQSAVTTDAFCAQLQDMGVKTIICTDISNCTCKWAEKF